MKRSLAFLTAAALVLPAAAPAMAQNWNGRDRHDTRQEMKQERRDARQAQKWRSFRQGQRFDRSYARNYAVIDYRRYHRLRPPPRGYHWVRSGNDALLVALGTGLIASVVANSF